MVEEYTKLIKVAVTQKVTWISFDCDEDGEDDEDDEDDEGGESGEDDDDDNDDADDDVNDDDAAAVLQKWRETKKELRKTIMMIKMFYHQW